MRKSILIFLFALLNVFIARAYGFEVNGIYYNIISGTDQVEVTSGSVKYSGPVVIPATVMYNDDTYRVTSVGNYAFYNCTGLTSVTIGESVITIGQGAFSSCSGLTSVTIGERVTTIGNQAFYGCTGLTSVTIPESVTSIGPSAFQGCTGLTSVTIPESVTTIGDQAFYGCDSISDPLYNSKIFAYLPKNYSGEYTIPSGIQSIAPSAFYVCNGLKAVTIPESVTTIGVLAFYGTGLLSVTSLAQTPPRFIENSVSFIGFDGFTYALGTLYVPQGCKSAYESAKEWHKFSKIEEIEEAGATYTVTVLANDASMGTVSGGNTYASGVEATLKAVPNAGYHFVKWDDENTDNPRTLTVTADITLTAIFAENVPDTYTVTVLANDASMGTVSGGNTYASGAEATLTAVPNAGYHFVKWDDENTDNPRMLTVTADITLTAIFAANENIKTYTVMVNVNDASMGTVIGGGEYKEGEQAILAAIPYQGYHFVKWDDNNTANPRIMTVTESITLTAIFDKDEAEPPVVYTVTVQPNDASMGTVTGGGEYKEGEQTILAAIPNKGYYFARWDDGNTNNPRILKVSGDTTITAVFAKNADPTANENSEADHFRVYVQDRTIHLSEDRGVVRVYNVAGQCVYNGHATAIPVQQSGVYVVVTNGKSHKVIVR